MSYEEYLRRVGPNATLTNYNPATKGYIFVFGSNLKGVHGGAAKEALDHWGATLYKGVGLQGQSYAIPTKDRNIETLPLEAIEGYVLEFLEFARNNQDFTFLVTAIGCGLAGYSPAQISPFFKNSTSNCVLPKEFGGCGSMPYGRSK